MTEGEQHVSQFVAAIRACDRAAVERALADGENPRLLHNGETPLHTAVRGGSIEIVEALIVGGALEWVPDASGHNLRQAERRDRRARRLLPSAALGVIE